jgi:DNA-binding response OmpR family regulator
VRILVVEDEAKLARAVRQGLEGEGYEVEWAPNGEDGFYRLARAAFDVVVLDWMLPGRSGIEILETMRREGRTTPVLMLTARDAVEDRVQGLEAGADDYLVKPFAFAELSARIRALLRRGRPDQALRLKVADLEMDLLTRRVTRGQAELDLTGQEYELLQYLLRHAGHVVSRQMLAQDVWKEAVRATPLDNVIDVQMTRLRRKVDPPDVAALLHTVRGVGFVLREGPP